MHFPIHTRFKSVSMKIESIPLKLSGVALLGGALALSAATNRLNVLFIAVDDLRPELGCYGVPIIKSPNLDQLAARGLVFQRAYCQQAFCSPSRSSLLTGRRPDTTKVYDLEADFRTALPGVVTLPQYFKQQGYHSQGMGKIYHNKKDDAISWSVPHWDAQTENPIYGPKGRQATRDRQAAARAAGRPHRWEDGVKGPFYDDPDIPDDALPDGKTAERAMAVLREIKDRTFFLAVGFHKPHLPFVAPKKYWDLYSEPELALATNPLPGRNAPPCAFHDGPPNCGYLGMPRKGELTEAQARKLIHGYYAAISYADAQVGRLLHELDRLGLRDKTIVLLWGDHGWHLGDHGLWGKQTNFENATRAPMILSVPGNPRRAENRGPRRVRGHLSHPGGAMRPPDAARIGRHELPALARKSRSTLETGGFQSTAFRVSRLRRRDGVHPPHRAVSFHGMDRARTGFSRARTLRLPDGSVGDGKPRGSAAVAAGTGMAGLLHAGLARGPPLTQ